MCRLLTSSGFNVNRLCIATSTTISPRCYSTGDDVGFAASRIFGVSHHSECVKKRVSKSKALGISERKGRRGAIQGSLMPSAASTYPLRGLLFFLRKENRAILWNRVSSFAAEVGASSAVLLGTIAGFTFHAQRSFLWTILPHFLGTPGTIALILVETAVPVTLLFYHRLRRVQEKLFEDVLRLENVRVERASPDELGWIADQRLVQQRQNQADVSRTRSLVTTLTDPEALNNHPLTKYFLTLPLNFVPVVGQGFFIWLNALETATSLHHHYYRDLKGLSPDDEATVIHVRKGDYQRFGVVASALTLLPGLNVILVLTNAVGAALWAADLEKDLFKRLR